MEHACTGLSEAETALHAHLSNHAWRYMGSIWRPRHQWGLRVTQVTGSCNNIRFQARCMVRQGTTCEGRMEPHVPYKAAGGSWGRFIKLKNLEHACIALSEAEMAAHAHLRNHAWQHMGPTWGARPPMGLGHTSGEGGRAIISGYE